MLTRRELQDREIAILRSLPISEWDEAFYFLQEQWDEREAYFEDNNLGPVMGKDDLFNELDCE